MKLSTGIALLLLVFMLNVSISLSESEGGNRKCIGCYERNIPNFRTRFRHQKFPHPRHRGVYSDVLGRKMLQTVYSSMHSAVKTAAHQMDHPDRYVPGGPDPLHHRSTPPSMLVPDFN